MSSHLNTKDRPSVLKAKTQTDREPDSCPVQSFDLKCSRAGNYLVRPVKSGENCLVQQFIRLGAFAVKNSENGD